MEAKFNTQPPAGRKCRQAPPHLTHRSNPPRPQLHQPAAEGHDSLPLLSQTAIVALPPPRLHRRLTCWSLVIMRQQVTAAILIISACFIFIFLFIVEQLAAQVRGGAAQGALVAWLLSPGCVFTIAVFVVSHRRVLVQTDPFGNGSVFKEVVQKYYFLLLLLLEKVAVEQGGRSSSISSNCSVSCLPCN